MERGKIAVIGTGKVGTALSRIFYSKGYSLIHFVSRNMESALKLSSEFGATASVKPYIPSPVDFVLIAVPDSSLKKVISEIEGIDDKTILMHTAGSYSLDVYPAEAKYRKGIFYPLQTFTIGRETNLENIPVFIEASDDITIKKLESLAKEITTSVFATRSEERIKLHLAAVFVCNFVNHMFTAGEEILGDSSIPADVLRPLIKETFDKALEMGSRRAQTGPAVRHDLTTIEKHLNLLSYSPELKAVYKSVTESIIRLYNKPGNDQL